MVNPVTKMTAQELKTTGAISSLFALRLLGLFMVLPLLSLFAQSLPGATPKLIGFAVGCYGLTQALFQIPFGALSDRYPRKLIIAVGLIIFMVGSVIAALATNIWALILGRALQGTGAVGSTTIALITDYTRESQRTKAMAIMGISIGASFVLALIIGPILATWLEVPGLFWLSAFLGVVCFGILFYGLPAKYAQVKTEITVIKQFKVVLRQTKLLSLNIGIFILHAILTSCFVVLPLILKQQLAIPAYQQWHLYLPSLLLGCLLILPLLKWTSEGQYENTTLLFMIVLLIVSQLWLWLLNHSSLVLGIGLTLFFAAFNFLEANLPALISKLAPEDSKGTAMGIYSSSQFLGIFVGGILGGWLYGQFQPSVVFLFCAMLALFWFIITFFFHRSSLNGQGHQ